MPRAFESWTTSGDLIRHEATVMDCQDRSNGWEDAAATFIVEGRRTRVGVDVVQGWVRLLPENSAVLDLGCGPGTPRSEPLFQPGVDVYAVDASPTLAAAYQARFPQATVACEAAEESSFFNRRYAGVLSWGLLFLLAPAIQKVVIDRVAEALNPGGRFLFTAPAVVATWADLTTGRRSVALGAAEYRRLLEYAGLRLVRELEDEGQNHYYDAVKPQRAALTRAPTAGKSV